MFIRPNRIGTVAILLFFGFPAMGRTQTSDLSLEDFILQTVIDTKSLNTPTIGEWEIRHTGEKVEAPAERDRDYDRQNARSMHDRELEGRWCLRSTAQISLADGISARRIALFYQPLVGDTPLPTESGDDLRRHGCGLTKILYEFDGVTDENHIAEIIGELLPGKHTDNPEKSNLGLEDEYWKPVKSLSGHGYFYLFVHNPLVGTPKEKPDPKLKGTISSDKPAVLLEWKKYSSSFGQPSKDTINPEAGQPWLALRAAKLARLPEGPTLDMLSFLAPQVGEPSEQPPFHCRRQLVPFVRRWMGLAAKIQPERHAAALVLANEVLGRLSECDEFSDSDDYVPSEADGTHGDTDDALRKDLNDLGIETWKSARPGPERYAGNLLEQVPKLAPNGPMNELYRMAILNERCRWSSISGSDCSDIIKEGESFLSTFPPDEWTPSVHLILAEAYAITAADTSDFDYVGHPDPNKAELEKMAALHYRAWYAKSTNWRDRGLVWREIWALDAGIGPWLNLPWVYQQ